MRCSDKENENGIGKKVFLSVSALNLSRKERAEYYKNDTISDDIKNYWQQLPFNDPKIVTAYINYISWLIDTFNPLYVNYGVESNVDTWNFSDFNLYKDFLAQVYLQLEIKYPSIPFLLVSSLMKQLKAITMRLNFCLIPIL